MKKWLAAFGAVILVMIFFLWRELDSSSAAPVEPAKPASPVEVARAPEPKPVKAVDPAPAPAKPAAPVDPATEKMDPQSDEFFREHDEIVTKKLMMQAVKCWESLPAAKRETFNRNQSLKAKFKQKIRDGVVTVEDLEVTESSIHDTALEACFVQQLRSTTWSNPRLPDWDQDDTIKLGPRTLKKYTKENTDYVGAEAPSLD